MNNGEPGLDLELNNGEDEWKPVTVLKPCSNDLGLVAEKLSMVELSDFDDVMFRSHEIEDTPGLNLRQSFLGAWTLANSFKDLFQTQYSYM